MNQQQIKYFLTIVKHMSLTRAAQELYITQPALSNALAKLEKELGVSLFYRTGNRILLTEAGEIFEKKFRVLSDVYKEIYELAEIMSKEKIQKLTIGFSGSIMVFLTMNVTGFLSSYQNVSIQKVYADQQKIIQMLKNQEIDLAITCPMIDDSEICSHLIHKNQIVLAVSSAHPLSEKKEITLEDLEQYDISLLTSTNSFRRNCDELLKQKNIKIHGKEYEYADYVRHLEAGKYGQEVLAFTTDKDFEKWYGRGYLKKDIQGIRLEQITGVSWLLKGDIQYRYTEIIDLVKKEYSKVYSSNLRK